MAKKNTFSTLLIFVIFALSVFAVINTTTKSKKIVPYINDGWVSWNSIEKIDIYSDGYYGRTMEEPLSITDKEEIDKIIKCLTDTKGYRHIPEDKYLEGLCNVFVDFGNGCVISMYADENYGTIDSEIKHTADEEGYFSFPEKFIERIKYLLETNTPSK